MDKSTYTVGQMDESDWWRDNPCPLNRHWGLREVSDIDLKKLKYTLKTCETAKYVMVIESLIYRAFLASPMVRGFCNQKPNKASEALKFLKAAEDRILDSYSEEAKLGYQIVIYTFRMWLLSESIEKESTEVKLKQMESMKTQFPKYMAYVNAIHAQILSRLGRRYRAKAISLYQKALDDFPDNYEWLYGMAVMIGNDARCYRSLVGAWKSPLPDELIRKFREEERILEKILSIKQDFFLARALYGQVLFNLDNNSKRAKKEIKKALKGNASNRIIAILASKFYRRKGVFSEAQRVLEEVRKRNKSSDFYFELGCVFHDQSHTGKFNKKQRDQCLMKALRYLTMAIDLDSCNFLSAARCAEIHGELGNVEKARRLYNDLLIVLRDKSHHSSDEFETLTSALKLDIFEPREHISHLYRVIQLAVLLTDDSNDDVHVQTKSLRYTSKNYLQKLEQYTEVEDETVKYQARLAVADAKLLLKQFHEAENLYKSLYDIEVDDKKRCNVAFSLGRCRVNQGEFAKDREQANRFFKAAIEVANHLDNMKVVTLSNEIYADVNLAKAKIYHPLPGHEEKYNHLLQNLIKRGSLQGCYMYMLDIENLKKNFFTDDNIPETLAGIQVVCANESPLHVQFAITAADTSKIDDDVGAKKNYIQRRVEDVKTYDIFSTVVDCNEDAGVISISNQLKDLRQKRVSYELELMDCKRSKAWGDEHLAKLTDVIRVLRQILDNTVSVCQSLLLNTSVYNSMFLITKAGDADGRTCMGEVENWFNQKFPRKKRRKAKPKGFLEEIARVQPLNNKDNNWLWAIHHLNNTRNHSVSKLHAGKYFTFECPNDGSRVTILTEEVVRKSCKHVERLVVNLIKMCLKEKEVEEVTR